MPIIINDANILIDLMKIELLDAFFQLDFEMHVTDFVISEITDENAEKMETYMEKKELHLKSFSFQELHKLQSLNEQYPPLSLPDCSCLFWAEKTEGMLLTGDGKLRNTARKRGVTVHGILWIFDQMLSLELIKPQNAFEKMNLLMEINPRLPQKECKKRLKLWRLWPTNS